MTVEQIRNELHRLNKQYKQVLQERSMAREHSHKELLTQLLEEIDMQIEKLAQQVNESV